MTGPGSVTGAIEGLDAGADDFPVKPVRLDEVMARVRAHLRSRAAWSESLEDDLRVRTRVVRALRHVALSSDPEILSQAVVRELAQGYLFGRPERLPA